jgi:hypothetical protein
MKKTIFGFIFCAVLLCSGSVSAQNGSPTKAKTIEWIKNTVTAFAFNSATQVEVSVCYIIIHYQNGNKDLFDVSDFGVFYVDGENDVAWINKGDENETKHWFLKNTTAEIREKLTNALRHLQTFCEEEKGLF